MPRAGRLLHRLFTSIASTASTASLVGLVALLGAGLGCAQATAGGAGPPAAGSSEAVASEAVASEAVASEAVASDAGSAPARAALLGARETFAAAGVDGAFMVRRPGAADLVYGGALVDERRRPCSTFKIASALIALEEGVVPDADFRLPWDGVERWAAAWNRDHDLRSAMETSAVWYFQELARRIGAPAMAAWLVKLEYGDAQIGEVVDTFWLAGPLGISAAEEVGFVDRLVRGALPVSARSASIVREILPTRSRGGALIRAKTGACDAAEGRPPHAWLVGWVERGDAVTGAFALLVTAPAEIDALTPVRWPLALALLEDAGLVDAETPG